MQGPAFNAIDTDRCTNGNKALLAMFVEKAWHWTVLHALVSKWH